MITIMFIGHLTDQQLNNLILVDFTIQEDIIDISHDVYYKIWKDANVASGSTRISRRYI